MKKESLNWIAIASLCFMVGMSSCVKKANDEVAHGPSGTINGHDWVDMGTSVKWATTNVGASKPKGKGDYFTWGEAECDDAARANWGATWRMPTDIEWLELMNKCDWEWYGSGYKVTAENGNVLYLPAAGNKILSWPGDVGNIGNYWGASPVWDSKRAWCLYFASNGLIVASDRMRGTECSVRPVSE